MLPPPDPPVPEVCVSRRSRSVNVAVTVLACVMSTVQVGITLVGILAGAIGGATVGERLAQMFSQVPVLAPVADAAGFAVVVIVTTYLSLILGELVPKQIALGHPERIAARVAGPMHTLSVMAAPVVALLEGSTNLVMRATGLRKVGSDQVSEEEVRTLIAEGQSARDIRHKAVEEGMLQFRQSALLKVARGETTTEEIFRVIPSESLLLED